MDYSTHTGQGYEGDFFLAIGDDCILHLYKGTVDCDSVSVEEELWTNVHLEPLKNGDRLGKGEYVNDNAAGTKLVMQSSDGNLVLYGSGDFETDNVLWAANEEWDGPPSPDFHEHYARVAHNGDLVLVGKDYQDGSEAIYFTKSLNVGGAACFTVQFNETIMDLVAVSCDD